MEPTLLLGRVLRHEVNVSALLAYLIAREPAPLERLLALRSPITDVRVEVKDTRRNRYDVVVSAEQGVAALLELKVSAAEHGDQLSRYASATDGALRVLVDLESPTAPLPSGWTRMGLENVFACWTDSTDPTTREFSREIAGALSSWRDQLDGPLGRMDPAMLPVALRMIANTLDERGIEATASGTAVGKPSLTVWRPHEATGDESAFLCVDVRCENTMDAAESWLFRVGVEVPVVDGVPTARRLAHRLAMQLEPALRNGGLHTALEAELPAVAPSLLRTAPLKSPRHRDDRIAMWLSQLDAVGDAKAPRHPVFHHDWGRRLAGQYRLDIRELTPTAMIDLVTTTLRFLESATA